MTKNNSMPNEKELRDALDGYERMRNNGSYPRSIEPHLETLKQALQYALDRRWQPIESAPKDGQTILVCSDKGTRCSASWEEERIETENEHIGYSCYDDVCYEHEAGFVGGIFDTDAINESNGTKRKGLQPTYWTPLPLPPETQEVE